MQFNYIFLEMIQGEEKINLMKSLSNSEDLCLFEQEAIQMIIDYKWHTYAESFFRKKFYIYVLFLFTFYYDLESMHNVDEEGRRIKNQWFIIRKVVCWVIQIYFLGYEFV